jgi:hypothetical protein
MLVQQLSFPRKQPLKRPAKFPADSEENLGADLHLSMLHRGEIVLADSNASCKFLLRHIKSAELADPPPNGFPIHGGALGAEVFP